MKIDIVPDPSRPGYFTVIPHEPIDSLTYQAFADKVRPLLVPSTKGILLDLSRVRYISSAGLGEFFTMKKILAKNRGELLFCHLQPQIRKLFDIVKALPPETIFENTEEADRYFYRMMDEEIDEPESGDRQER